MFLPEVLGSSPIMCVAVVSSLMLVTLSGILWRKYAGPLFPILLAFACVCIFLIGIFCPSRTVTLPLPWFLGDAPISFVIDPLSRWFLIIIGGIGIPVVIFTPGYLYHLRNHTSLGLVWSALALLIGSMTGVVLAANALVFLVAWEVMGLSSFALVATNHEMRAIRRAAFIYLGATRVGATFLMAGFLWAHALTGSWAFSDWHLSGIAALGPSLLIFIGLAAKAGCWPFHLWLPVAHPAAPAPVSAIMSGVMIKTAIYAMVRLFVVGGHLIVPSLGPLLLILGAISAFWGVVFALLQHDIKRLLAYHSVENIGIILMGLGVSILGVQWHLPLLAQLGLAAALFHTLNHAVFKSLLFLGSGAIDSSTHSRDVEHLGGLIHRMPWTAGCFIIGAAAICALPPLNGFASEWLLYQGFFGMALHGLSVAVQLGAVLLMGWLALIGSLAIACFVKAVGVVFLGLPRSPEAERSTEASHGMIIAQVLLALFCVAMGVSAPYLLIALSYITAPLGDPALLPGVWTLPMPLIAMLLIGSVGTLAAWMGVQSHWRPAHRYNTWECGFGKLGPRMQYTAASFAQPISRLFGAIYHYAIKVSYHGRQRRHFPEVIEVETQYEAYLETQVYAPALRGFHRASGVFLMRLQAGSIHQYLLYMVIMLGILLWVGTLR